VSVKIVNFIKIKINNFFKLFGYQIISYKKNVYTFVEKYSSYKQALLKSKNEETYVTKNFQKKQNLMRLETLETSDRFHIFPVFFSAILNQNSKKLEFLEVGGGNNPIFLHFLKCNNKKVKFHVLEEKNFKMKVPNKFKNYLIYYNNLKQINFQNLNSIIFSGSIQYMENYQEILSKAFNRKLKYIIITETFFTSKKKIFILCKIIWKK
jgi:putative methyltransferase (TIGR04325 family)